VVLCARPLTWPRELTLTSLVARLGVSPFGKLLLHLSPALAALPFLHFSFTFEAAMTPRIQKRLSQPPSHEPLHVTHRHAAGIDVHANVHWVAVPPQTRHRHRMPPAKFRAIRHLIETVTQSTYPPE